MTVCFYFMQKTVEKLRKTLRELEVEFEVQRKLKKGLEDLKDGLLAELTFLRWVYPNHFCFNLVKVKIINE